MTDEFDPFASPEDKPKNRSGMTCPIRNEPVLEACQTCEFWRPVPTVVATQNLGKERWACAHNMQWILAREAGFQMQSVYEMLAYIRDETCDRQDILTELMAIGMGKAGRETLVKLVDAKKAERQSRKQIGHQK